MFRLTGTSVSVESILSWMVGNAEGTCAGDVNECQIANALMRIRLVPINGMSRSFGLDRRDYSHEEASAAPHR
jgi:hypothetical protein